MQYLMFIYEKPGSLQSLTEAERQQVAQDFGALTSDSRVTPVLSDDQDCRVMSIRVAA